MARGSKSDAEANEILEQGDIFFLFRPTVNEEEPHGLTDVQRFFIVLRSERDRKLRLLVVGRKRLPDVRSHERVWGFVDTVTSDPAEIKAELLEQTYQTKTRGVQRRPAARPVGEGAYVITLSGGQLHLAYALGAPDKPAAA
jgi:hypothetical protein